MIPRVMTDAIMPTARELNERFGTMGARLERAARLNYFSGTAEFYEAEIRGAFIDALGQEEGEVWAREFVMLLRDDFAVLQRPEQSGDIGVAIPWRLLVQPARPEILSPMLLTEFAIGPNMTPVMTRAVMTQRFHNVPASVLDEQNLEKLSQIAMFGMLRSLSGRWKETLDDIDSAFTVTIKSGGGPTGTVPSGSVFVDVANQALACLSNARITLHWWGPEICFDERCGRLIAQALVGGGSGTILSALATLAGGGTLTLTAVKGAVAAAGGVFAVVAAGAALYTGISIQANITSRGVCLQALWPLTGGLVWWASGIP